jgi:hypothetical protein
VNATLCGALNQEIKYMKMAILLLLVASFHASSQEPKKSTELLEIDNKYDLKNADDREKRRQELLQLAENGDIYANYYLGLSNSAESRDYLFFAAKEGHSKATERVLDLLFMNSSTFTKKNPSLALEITRLAVKKNAELDVYKLPEKIKLLEKCSEADPFDEENFIKANNVKSTDSPWKWAKIVSQNTKDMKTTFQLVCRGGETSAEFGWAVEEFYKYWKSGKAVVFEPCSYAAGKFTMGGCASGSLYQ